VEVLTSFCARRYGRRSARNRALKAVRCAERDIGPAGLAGAARGDGDRVAG
jgi:putative resolvase